MYKGKEPVEFASLPYTSYEEYTVTNIDSISEVLETYYASRNIYTRIRQKSSDRVVS